MNDFAMINYLIARGWQPTDNQLFTLAGRTGNPVDLPLAYCIQRHLERVHEKIKQMEIQQESAVI
jgi:hypothetical protein